MGPRKPLVLLAAYYNEMGSKILSSDMLVNTYLNPAIWSYVKHEYDAACLLLFSFNNFFKTFGEGIDDMPIAREPVTQDVRDRVNPANYFRGYFDRYLPLISICLGKYQRLELELVKEESGRY